VGANYDEDNNIASGKDPMPTRIKKAVVYLLLAYWIVTLFGFLLTLAFWAWLPLPTAQELGVSASQSPAYLLTVPYHPLLNLLVWPFFAALYLRNFPAGQRKGEALRLGAFWVIITMVVDLIGWVLIKHPWSMTFKQMYVDYQPWITLIYLVIFGAPLAVLPFLKTKTVRETA
jgi:hypothetical protein